MEFFTIGVYGYTEEEFFSALTNNRINVFIDIRQRRGMRGPKYKFVNSSYLQKKLEEMNIKYIHLKELAPNTYVRNQQKSMDTLIGTSKSNRSELSKAFITAYNEICLSNFDSIKMLNQIGVDKFSAALFCVESTPQACHRGLVAKFLKDDGYIINHIVEGECQCM